MDTPRPTLRPPVDWATFTGLTQPGCTQVPDELLDWIMAYLTGAELKVLLYIVRRTFGFKKDADAISLDQLCHGITRHDGRHLDLGTGLKRPTVLQALRSLRARNLIVATQQRDRQTGSRPTVYALRLRTPGAEGGMSAHTPGYAASDASGVEGVCSRILPGYGGADPQETGLTRDREQGDRRARVEQAAAWTAGDSGAGGVATSPREAAVSDPLWTAVLAELQQIVTPENYATWLAPTQVVRREGNCLYVATVQAFQRDWLDYKLRGRIESVMSRLGYGALRVEFIVDSPH